MKRIVALSVLCIFGTDCAATPCLKETLEVCSAGSADQNPKSAAAPSELVSQANVHIQQRQYQQAFADIKAAAKLAPDNPEYALFYCMLKERAGEPLPEARACYADVVERLSQDDGTACASNINCVVADLMAGGANAEQRKTYFLGLPASETESEMRHFLLDDFDRKEYLHSILP